MKLIKYQITTTVNHGTDEEPDIEQILNACEIHCTADNLETNLVLARAEAYNGEVTVEDIPDETSAPTEEEKLRADVDYLLMLMED